MACGAVIVILVLVIVIIIAILAGLYAVGILKIGRLSDAKQNPMIARLMRGQNTRAFTGSGAKREVEARFLNINVADIVAKLKKMHAKRTFKATKLMRTIYYLDGGYVRVRTEPRKGKLRAVLTSKVFPRPPANVAAQQNATSVAPMETEVVLDSGDTYDDARQFLQSCGLKPKAEHENWRESWHLGECAVDIDWLPGLEPSLEIECSSEEHIKALAKELGLDYGSAIFGAYGKAYERTYGVSEKEVINNGRAYELKFASVGKILGPFVVSNREMFDRVVAIGSPF